MSNTIAGVSLAEIAQESLPFFGAALLPLNAITTNFSSEYKQQGSTVTTRVPSGFTAADLSSGYVSAVANTTLTAKTITLNQFYGNVVGFSDLEQTQSAFDLIRLFIEPSVNALGVKVFGDIWNLVNDTNLPAAAATESTITAVNFDRDDLVDIAKVMTDNKCPKARRFALLNTAYYAALAKDLNSVDTAGTGQVLNENTVMRVAGFDVYESAEADANSVNVGGFFGHPAALLFAASPLKVPVTATNVEVENVVVPGLGLPIQFRRWYDANTGTDYMSVGVLYGVQWGLTPAGHKVVSA